MTDTLLSIISILVGIIGGNSTKYFYKKYTFDIVGNTIAGVFGSVFFIKMFGRLGLNPKIIIHLGEINHLFLVLNLIVSFLGGLLVVILLKKIKLIMN